MRPPKSVAGLNAFTRTRLSQNFFMRDFLYSEIAALHGIANIPDDPELAIAAGSKLCVELFEPLRERFGYIAIRSAYRSEALNRFGNEQQRAGKSGYNCASAERNYAAHTWDRLDAEGRMGATACIFIPSVWDRFQSEGDWQKLAWWVHDHLPYHHMEFYPKYWAFNLTWREEPVRYITSYVAPRGTLTKPGMDNHAGDHSSWWRDL